MTTPVDDCLVNNLEADCTSTVESPEAAAMTVAHVEPLKEEDSPLGTSSDGIEEAEPASSPSNPLFAMRGRLKKMTEVIKLKKGKDKHKDKDVDKGKDPDKKVSDGGEGLEDSSLKKPTPTVTKRDKQ
ncbi:hypothetical protein PNOK_0918500 [Pyrrhoderma noxium]|uniref:Uncharacterized protein n=1 Tax=Pyrrhoderma noxium TaxID=2282107 RepID=A0A286U764_9AGAM|nr:hypothetical protein PNOK_0918500 [Pyrrhoderma noxium]